MACHESERRGHLAITYTRQPLKAWPDSFTQIAGIRLRAAQTMEEFNAFQQRLADVGWFGAYVCQNDQIRVKSLLLACHFGMADQPVLLHFPQDWIAGLVIEIAFPSLITHFLLAQLLLLVISRVQSDQA